MDERRTILVIGATGKQGGAAAGQLLAAGWGVRTLVRDPAGLAARRLAQAGAEVVAGDLDDRASLAAVAGGAYGVFLAQPGALGAPPVAFADEVRRGTAVVEAAAGAGAGHLVYSSVAAADRGASAGVRAFAAKREIEAAIAARPLRATVLRPVSFMDNYVDPAFGVPSGALATPFAPAAPEQLIAVRDIGAFVVAAFEDPSTYAGRTLALAGDALDPAGLAAALSAAAGRELPYVPVPVDALRAQSAELADAVAFLNSAGGYGADIAATRALRPDVLTFAGWLELEGRARLRDLLAAE